MSGVKSAMRKSRRKAGRRSRTPRPRSRMRKRNWRTLPGSWKTAGQSWRTRNRSLRTAGRIWKTEKPSSRKKSRSTWTPDSRLRTAGSRRTGAGGKSYMRSASWRAAGSSMKRGKNRSKTAMRLWSLTRSSMPSWRVQRASFSPESNRSRQDWGRFSPEWKRFRPCWTR